MLPYKNLQGNRVLTAHKICQCQLPVFNSAQLDSVAVDITNFRPRGFRGVGF